MASRKELIDFICEQLEGVGIINAKKMFGDWCIYVNEKPSMLVCDDVAYIKKLPEMEEMMKEAETGSPYPGAKEHYIVDVEHRERLLLVIQTLVPLLPLPKKEAKPRDNDDNGDYDNDN